MRRTVVGALALVVGACNFEHGSLQGDSGDAGIDATFANAPWPANSRYRKPITITPPALGATLTDVPIGIFAQADAQLAANARADGRDLIFTSDNGTTRLDHELVTFDAGTLEAWVRIPQLTGPSLIYLYYGDGAQVSTATTTWPSSFAGVWHLDTGVAGSDSTVNGHAAFSTASVTTPAIVDGIAGRARSFDGLDDSMSVADPADDSLDFGTTSFSFSVWINVATSNNTHDAPLYKGGASTGDPGYCVLLGTGDWNMKIHDGTNYRDPIAGTETIEEWVYLAGVVDRGASEVRAYRNSVLMTTHPIVGFGSVSNAQPLTFGPTGIMPFHGVLDEVRIVRGVLSPDRIATEYANLTSPSFAAFGAQQVHP
jgi:hypothetical protein